MGIRILDFADGFSSATQPTGSSGSASALGVFVDDAAFVTDKGSAAALGDLYINSTLNAVRYFDGTNWNSLDTILSLQDEFDFLNNTNNQVISGVLFGDLDFDLNDYSSVEINFEIYRESDTPLLLMSRGTVYMMAKGPTWVIEQESSGDATLVVFDVAQVGDVGTLRLDVGDMGGTPVENKIKFEIRAFRA